MHPYYIAEGHGHTVLAALFSHKEVYLTGSRYFGNSTKDSDYDFFTEDTNQMREWLRRNNFQVVDRPDATHHYTDEDMVAVYRHDYLSIDVQLVRNPKLRLRVQQQIKAWLTLPDDKVGRSKIWDFMFRHVKAVDRLLNLVS